MLIGALTDWAAARLASQAVVGPGEVVDPADDGRVLRPQLGAGAERVGLQRQQRAVGGAQLVLVERTLARARG